MGRGLGAAARVTAGLLRLALGASTKCGSSLLSPPARYVPVFAGTVWFGDKGFLWSYESQRTFWSAAAEVHSECAREECLVDMSSYSGWWWCSPRSFVNLLTWNYPSRFDWGELRTCCLGKAVRHFQAHGLDVFHYWHMHLARLGPA